MRHKAVSLLALAAICSLSISAQASAGDAALPAQAEPAAVITATSTGRSACSLRWNGDAVTNDAILQRSVELLEKFVLEVGLDNVTEDNLPYLRLEAGARVPYSCIGPALRTIQRAGFPYAMLREADGEAGDGRAYFFVDGAMPEGDPPLAIIRVGPGDRLMWDKNRIDLIELAQFLDVAETMDDASNGLVVAPSADVEFGALLAVMRRLWATVIPPVLPDCEVPSIVSRPGSPVC